MEIAKYFTESEMACKGKNCCGNSAPMDTLFMEELDALRRDCECPLYVTSGFRCKVHNERVGGAKNSWHTKGQAADLIASEISLLELYQIAEERFNEVLYYNDFIHVANPK